MEEREWTLSIDGLIKDDASHRIDDVDWGEAEKYGLDTFMVGLATGTGHRDAKIALSHQLIGIHNGHLAITHSNISDLLPEKIMDRMVYGMIAACNEGTAIPNVLTRLLSLRMRISQRPQKGIQDPVAYRNLLHAVANSPGIGKKKAAAVAGIKPSTAKKWMGDPVFKDFVEVIRKHGIKGGHIESVC